MGLGLGLAATPVVWNLAPACVASKFPKISVGTAAGYNNLYKCMSTFVKL